MIISNFLNKLKDHRPLIGVVGDAMIDRYIPVIVDRISPEFPNPITRRDQSKPILELPGGAANVAYQFNNFNVESQLITCYDQYASEVFDKYKIKGDRDTSYDFNSFYVCCEPDKRLNPVKTRFYSDDFPYSRYDDEMPFEEWKDLGGIDEDILSITEFETWVDFEALIISDYHKGFFHSANHPEVWVKRAPITIVDPKKNPISRWKGCTVFKPNEVEAKAISGKTDWEDQADYFLKELDCKHVVITQGGSGVVGKSSDGSKFEYRPSLKIPARSVIGAGDCFIAFLTMAYVLKFDIDKCAEIAFKAGSVYVQNIHNTPITPYQLLKFEDPISAKYLMPDVTERLIVFTNGVFDILHSSHINLLSFAKQQGETLVVGVNTDESVKKLKGDSRPINKLKDRMRILAAMSDVDHVIPFSEETPLNLIKKIKPEILVKGSDYLPCQVVGSTEKFVKKVVLFPYEDGNSTSKIIERCK